MLTPGLVGTVGLFLLGLTGDGVDGSGLDTHLLLDIRQFWRGGLVCFLFGANWTCLLADRRRDDFVSLGALIRARNRGLILERDFCFALDGKEAEMKV